MISIIVCSRHTPDWNRHERNVEKTVGEPYEYIRIDNRTKRYGLCAAYNEGVSRSKGDVLVFVHEDAFFMEPGWGNVLIRKFRHDESLGLVGVAGTQYLLPDSPAWLAAGQPFIRGRVVHETNGGQSYYLSVFSWDKNDAEVVAVDGLFFAIRRELFGRIRFDDKIFDKFHFYDLDICMQVRRTHKLVVTWDILVKHLSAGKCDETWRHAGDRFLSKYRNELPARCVDIVPELKSRVFGMNYDLKGILAQKTHIVNSIGLGREMGVSNTDSKGQEIWQHEYMQTVGRDIERPESGSENTLSKKTVRVSVSGGSRAFSVKFHLDTESFSQRMLWEHFANSSLYEAGTLQFVADVLQDGDCFVDIGAHIGYFSLIASRFVGPSGQVIAIEPEASNYVQLTRNIFLNDMNNICVINAPLGVRNGEVDFFFNSDNDGGHALWNVGLHPFNKKSREREIVQKLRMLTLDGILMDKRINRVKLIKIDTEGAEVDVLKGGANAIHEMNVTYIVCEVNRFGLKQMGTNEKELREFMYQLGYESYLMQDQSPNLTRLSPDQYVESNYVFNLLFARK